MEIKKKIHKFVIFIISPGEYHYKNIVLSILGINLFRIIFHKLQEFIKNSFYFLFLNKRQTDKKLLDILEKDGLILIPNFFKEKKFKTIERNCKKILDSLAWKKFRNNGGSIKTISIDEYSSGKEKREIFEIFTKNRIIKNLILEDMKVLFYWNPRVVLQEIYFPKGTKDLDDSVQILHSDRFVKHLKVFFYLNDQNEDNGAYVYAKKTHRYNLHRVFHEIEMDFRMSKNYLLRKHKLKTDKLHNSNYNEIRPFFQNILKVKPFSVNGKKNTLVVSNNIGFHARGKMLEKRRRIQIRIQYQYLTINIFKILFINVLNFFLKNFLKKKKILFN